MDILAHALWTGVGLAAWRQRRPISRRDTWLTVSLAVLPDLALMVPVTMWALNGGDWAVWASYAVSTPETEPILPHWVHFASHHLHCSLHSAIVAGVVTTLVWSVRRAFWLPLLGWWGHILVDVFTHSADFYPVPVFYPFTEAGFDGIAWNTPWFFALNYGALLLTAWVVLRRKS